MSIEPEPPLSAEPSVGNSENPVAVAAPDANAPAVIRTQGLTKKYGARVAVNNLDLQLLPGVTGFVGPNGAGKTTTIRMLLGLIAPTSGSGQVLNESLANPDRYLPRVGAMIETPVFYPWLSGRKNLMVLARLGGHSNAQVEKVLGQVELTDRADDRFKTYSLGMKQRLGLAAALLPDPELLLLDEPANGLDPSGIREMRELVRRFAHDGKTILISSHLLAEVEAVCDQLVLIDEGTLLFQGTVEALLARQQTELLLVPECSADLAALVALCQAAGHTAAQQDQSVRVQAPLDQAGPLNRAAHAQNITLIGIQATRGNLEDAFFSLTENPNEELP